MKINDILIEGPMDNFDLTPQQREIVALGHILKIQAATVKDDALSNAMARVGDELTSYGANFGPKNAKEVEKKSGVPMPVIKKLITFAKQIQNKQDSLNKDHKDGGLDDTNDTDDDYGNDDTTTARDAERFAKSKMGESTTAGSVAAVATPMGKMVSRQMKNSDGTAKNALDQDNILSNGKYKKKSRKRSY